MKIYYLTLVIIKYVAIKTTPAVIAPTIVVCPTIPTGTSAFILNFGFYTICVPLLQVEYTCGSGSAITRYGSSPGSLYRM